MHIDNNSAIAFAKNPVYYERSKYIDTMYHFIKEHVNNNEVELHYLAKSQDQSSRYCMKAIVVGVFNKI